MSDSLARRQRVWDRLRPMTSTQSRRPSGIRVEQGKNGPIMSLQLGGSPEPYSDSAPAISITVKK